MPKYEVYIKWQENHSGSAIVTASSPKEIEERILAGSSIIDDVRQSMNHGVSVRDHSYDDYVDFSLEVVDIEDVSTDA